MIHNETIDDEENIIRPEDKFESHTFTELSSFHFSYLFYTGLLLN